MHVYHEADKSNREIEYNSESNNKDNDDSNPLQARVFTKSLTT